MTHALKMIVSDESFEQRLAKLDLKPVMAHVQEEYGFNDEELGRAEELYRHFLRLIASRKPNEAVLVPPRIVDLVWHSHVLTTMRYADDCQYLFGRFIHHIPMAGDKRMSHLNESTLDYFNQFPVFQGTDSPESRRLATSGAW